MNNLQEDIKKHLREIPDFPKEGVLFYDITTVWGNSDLNREIIKDIAYHYQDAKITKIVGIESRGFVSGAMLAFYMDVPFVPIRKKGKLPYKTISTTYDTEYSKDTIEMHEDAIEKFDIVLIHDDILATGGTMAAAIELIEKHCQYVHCSSIIDLKDLGGKQLIENRGKEIYSILSV